MARERPQNIVGIAKRDSIENSAREVRSVLTPYGASISEVIDDPSKRARPVAEEATQPGVSVLLCKWLGPL
jgi:hypothetical protein